MDTQNVPYRVFILLAAILLRKGQYPGAINLMEQLLRDGQVSGDYDLNHNLAVCYQLTGQTESAIRQYRRTIDINPDSLADHIGYWACRWLQGDKDISPGGFAISTGLLKNHPDSSLHRLYSLCLARGGRLSEGIETYLPYYRRCIDSDRLKEDWYNYAVVLSSDDIQSQRFGDNQESVDKEFAHISAALGLSKRDKALDIGGAGGLLATRLAHQVREVTLTDISADLVSRAKANLSGFSNVHCVVGDIAREAPEGRFNKILMSRVTPVFKNFEALQSALSNIFSCLEDGGLCLITSSYDIDSAETSALFVLNSVDENRREDKKPHTKTHDTLSVFEEMLWIDIPRLERAAAEIGFSSMLISNERTLEDKRTMFDCILSK